MERTGVDAGGGSGEERRDTLLREDDGGGSLSRQAPVLCRQVKWIRRTPAVDHQRAPEWDRGLLAKD